MMKIVALLACLLVSSFVLVGQNKTAAIHEVDEPNAPSRLFEWNGKNPREVSHWLNQDRQLLNRCDICDLNVSWMDEETKAASAVQNVASFLIDPADEQVIWIIRHHESGIDVRVGVKYLAIKSGISQIRIALAFEGAPDDIFYEVSRAQADAIREKGWRSVASTKEIQLKNLLYTFTLTCTDSKKHFLITPLRRK